MHVEIHADCKIVQEEKMVIVQASRLGPQGMYGPSTKEFLGPYPQAQALNPKPIENLQRR